MCPLLVRLEETDGRDGGDLDIQAKLHPRARQKKRRAEALLLITTTIPLLENQLQSVLELPGRSFRVHAGSGTHPEILLADFPWGSVWAPR